ncbi:hypothetical protein [Geothermobacter hydrogeniphilus]|uniref:PD-(D/E)XK nuclease superfamily protein n=1 Tax=Geothermobacter hydrogeniphilus TaxID=1969733 RepID=A0A1X0Y864_9BACT|nr:hypothetical protein [Geothermobacter hydrogeniphilus]ORJ61355.1 hypothetical protein B5V00_06900 [Geothermobacter hydrogeniphilus]
MNTLDAPNIFDFATGELSQDAFICWLLKWLDYEGENDMKKAARLFVALLFETGGLGQVRPDEVENLQLLKQQYAKTDVFFIARVKGVDTGFILEDKVHTQPHSRQLQRYEEEVRKGYPDHPLAKIYFKTGYLFAKDLRECHGAGYGILGYREIYNFLNSVDTDDVIFISYRDYIRREFVERFETGLAALQKSDGHLRLKQDFVQYEFLKSLAKGCAKTIGSPSFSNGNSTGGEPWAHYRFLLNEDVFGPGHHERIWYRIEPRKDKRSNKRCYCLSLKQYAEPQTEEQKKLKLKRLKLYKDHFAKARKDSGLRFSKPLADRTGSNSSEIGILFFDEETNSLQQVVKLLPHVHEKFFTSVLNDQEL